MLEVGKLYVCEKYYLILFPDQKTIASVAAKHRLPPPAAADACAAGYWSKHFGTSVNYSEKNIPLLVLNNEAPYIEVLAGDKKGWIVYKYWLNIKEVS